MLIVSLNDESAEIWYSSTISCMKVLFNQFITINTTNDNDLCVRFEIHVIFILMIGNLK